MTQVLLWGGKSQAMLVARILEDGGHEISCIFDPQIDSPTFETSAEFSASSDDLRSFIKQCDGFAVCIGGEHGMARHLIAEEFIAQGLAPLDSVSPHSYISPDAHLGSGLQVMPGVVLNMKTRIGANCILNTSASVDHECTLGNGVHVMGGAAVSGGVTIGDYATVGTNATVLPEVCIGEGAFVGAGAVVLHDIDPYQVVGGNPSRLLRKQTPVVDLTPFESL